MAHLICFMFGPGVGFLGPAGRRNWAISISVKSKMVAVRLKLDFFWKGG